MNFSSAAFRSMYVMSGLGVTGVSGSGIIAWQSYEESNPTGHRVLSGKGLSFSHKFSPTLNSTVGSITNRHRNQLDIRTGDCFKNFFPQASAPDISITETGTEPLPSPSVEASSKQDLSIGCKLMNLGHTIDQKTFVFKSEITVKNDKYGLALLSGASNMKMSGTSHIQLGEINLNLNFFLYFLEKSSSNAWSIKAGYYWLGTIYLGQRFPIYDPVGDGKWFELAATLWTSNVAGPSPSTPKLENYNYKESDWVYKDYVGFWGTKSAEESGQKREVFEKVFSGIWKGEKYLHITALNEIYNGRAWKRPIINEAYLQDSGIYAPFKGKKGRWVEAKDYCKRLSSTRSLENPDLYRLKEFCYS